MSPIHRVRVVIGLTLTAVVAAGTAAAATRGRDAASAQTPVASAPITIAVVTAAQAHPRTRPTHRRARVQVHHRMRRSTSTRHLATHRATRAALDAAIARIPTYRPGGAIWVVSNKYGYWGTADWYHDMIYIAPGVPTNRLYDVAVHEWSHELSVLDYAGDVDAAVRAMNAVFGGSGLTGAERAADCMAILQHATWTHYTTCRNTEWRNAAARLVAGQRL